MSFPHTISGKAGFEKTETASQKHKLGTRMVLPDGRVFYYALNGGSDLATAGLVVMGAAVSANHDMDLTVTSATSAGSQTIELEVPTTDLTLNQYKDGYIYFNGGGVTNSSGQIYGIKSHPAHDASADASCVFTIEDEGGTYANLVTTDEAGLVLNPYNGIIVYNGDGTLTTGPIGVTTIKVTANYYCWVQTLGIAAVRQSGTQTIVGNAVEVSEVSSEDGEITLADSSGGSDLVDIGTAMQIQAAANDHQLVMLNIRA